MPVTSQLTFPSSARTNPQPTATARAHPPERLSSTVAEARLQPECSTPAAPAGGASRRVSFLLAPTSGALKVKVSTEPRAKLVGPLYRRTCSWGGRWQVEAQKHSVQES